MEDYKKYRWFFTSSGKLVLGGKSAVQNEEIVNNAKGVLLHTAAPGSPFCVIEKPTKKELEEAAIFTACFGQEWKRGKKKARVHVFESNQLIKDKKMKTGTFGVLGKVKDIEVDLKLGLCFQKKILRAVPLSACEDKILEIIPGKLNKEKAVQTILNCLEQKGISVSKDEVFSAIPSDKIEIKH